MRSHDVSSPTTIMVWTIAVVEVISWLWGTTGVFIYSFETPPTPAVKAYIESLTLFDYASTLILGATNITGLILLFLPRKSAVRWLAIGLILNVAVSIRVLLSSSYFQMIPAPESWIYLLGGFLVGLAILLYAIRLERVGILSESS